MQQAYRELRVVAEEQTIRIVLSLTPTELMLTELHTACTDLHTQNSRGVKAVVLDFRTISDTPTRPTTPATPATLATLSRGTEKETLSSAHIDEACKAVRAVEPPVLAVVRNSVSSIASKLIQAADLTLVAQHAALNVREMGDSNHDTLTGEQALRMGYVTWSVPAKDIDTQMERILSMLREKSATALRLTKASTRLGSKHTPQDGAARLQALKQVNEFYLAQVMQTADAAEGLQAFLEKRKPQWKNR